MRKFDTCFFERYAQITLETVLGERYASLVNVDRPDLQMPDGTLGIEVTRAMEPRKEEALTMLKEMADANGVTEEVVKQYYTDEDLKEMFLVEKACKIVTEWNTFTDKVADTDNKAE
jgi:hypothetical protein